MNVLEDLLIRSGKQCELCTATTDLSVYEVPQLAKGGPEGSILVCGNCLGQLENADSIDPNHWRCLNESMWSEHDAVKVVAWRMLNRLKGEGWPQDLLDMMYLDDEVLQWAKAGIAENTASEMVHRDSNGAILQAGDSVVLIKDLKVKGSSMVAKQGTAVRRISLDHENEKYIEGKVDGQHIVLITDFVKKM